MTSLVPSPHRPSEAKSVVPPSLTFLGGVGTVTGSRYLLQSDGHRVLVDCGLFQGFKQLRLRNWMPFAVPPASIEAVVLTHAHIDHSGYLPLLVKNGFKGRIYCTDATRDLCAILLPDSGFLQEKDAEYANRYGFSKHSPALPLYTKADAERALDHFTPTRFDRVLRLGERTVRFLPAGHILGAAIVEVVQGATKIVFSGDLGRPGSPTMVDPTPIADADYLVVESTYGDRRHDRSAPDTALAEIVGRTALRGGTLIVAAFAVGRAQELMYHLSRLKASHRMPDIPVYLDSPMAIDASKLMCAHLGAHRLSEAECRAACGVAHYVTESEESRALDDDSTPKIIISASGMATGGRVLHHLKRYAPERRNTILFTGFQAGGTRGATMLAGAETIRIHGQDIPVRAEVTELPMLSAHADADEIMGWLGGFRRPPRQTFVTHGEPAAADTLRRRIEHELGWSCTVPEYQQIYPLG